MINIKRILILAIGVIDVAIIAFSIQTNSYKNEVKKVMSNYSIESTKENDGDSLSETNVQDKAEVKKKVTISSNEIAMNGKYDVVVPDGVKENEMDIEGELDKINTSEEVKELVINEIRSLQNGDKATVQKWYGVSDIFTPEYIGMTSSRVIVNFNDNLVDSRYISLHICSVQNNEVEKAMRELADKEEDAEAISNEIGKRILEGEFNRCYEVAISTDENGIVPTEELKVIMSGGKYNTVDVNSVECSIKHNEEELKYE